MPRTIRWIPIVLCLVVTAAGGWAQPRAAEPTSDEAFIVYFVKPFVDEAALLRASEVLAAEHGGTISETIGDSAAVLLLEPAVVEKLAGDRRIAWVRRDLEVSPRWLRATATCNGSPETTEAIPEVFDGEESIRLSRIVADLGARGGDLGASLRGRCDNRETSARICEGDCICGDVEIYVVTCGQQCSDLSWPRKVKKGFACIEAGSAVAVPPDCRSGCQDLGIVVLEHIESACCRLVHRRECAEPCDDDD